MQLVKHEHHCCHTALIPRAARVTQHTPLEAAQLCTADALVAPETQQGVPAGLRSRALCMSVCGYTVYAVDGSDGFPAKFCCACEGS